MTTDNRSFDAVLFDYGGVFVTSPFNSIRGAAEASGHDPDVLLDVMFGPYHEDTDHPWHRIERGETNFENFFDEIRDLATERGVEVNLDLLMGLGDLQPRPRMVEFAQTVAGDGYSLALVTNNIAEGRSMWTDSLPMEIFGAAIDSSAEGVRKPNPAIFHLTLERLGGVSPHRALMVDDAPGNVDGAWAAGLAAVLVTDDDESSIAAIQAALAGKNNAA